VTGFRATGQAVALLVLMGATSAAAQDSASPSTPATAPAPTAAATPTPVMTIDPASLERIQKTLAKPSVFRSLDNPFRFYAVVVSKQPPSFAEQMKTWGDLGMTPITAPGGRPPFAGGMDFGPLVGKLFGRYFQSRRNSQLQELRDRIREELRALNPEPRTPEPGTPEPQNPRTPEPPPSPPRR
jgi:hypothetical protein